MKKLTHGDLKKAATQYLEAKGYIVINIYSGGFKNKDGKWFPRKNVIGVSDLICCSPKGIFMAVEIKIKPDKPRPEQDNFLYNVIENFGMAFVIYSIDDLITMVDGRKESNENTKQG